MRLAILLVLFSCLNVQAQDTLTTTAGKTYTGITSIKPSGNAVRIIHADGAATVRYDAIPEADRPRFGYDPEKAAAVDAAEKAAAEASAKQAAAASKPSPADQRKSAAVEQLRSVHFGGASYWKMDPDDQLAARRYARSSLMQAGHSESQANAIIDRMITAGKAEPIPPSKPIPAEFTQPQGALRGVPNGDHKKKGIAR